jgi:hypothetical protein
MALTQAGCRVNALCLPGHPFEKTGVVRRFFPLDALHPLVSLQSALQQEFPDAVISCEDRATALLHNLYECAGNGLQGKATRDLLEKSLGDPRYYHVAASRNGMLKRARALGVRIPEGQELASVEEMESWLAKYGFPAYIKADGTSGGVGVKQAMNLREARQVFRKLHAPPLLARVLKRILVDRDPVLLLPFLRRERPQMSIQRAIRGRDANCAIACWQGEILSMLCMEVIQRTEAQGPGSVLRQIRNEEMENAARAVVKSLGLSGLVGLDFMIEDETEAAYLLELNPRSTQTAHLCMGEYNAPAFAFAAKLQGRSVACTSNVPSDTVALFPQEWQRDPESEYLSHAYHDVPWHAPDFVHSAMMARPSLLRGWSPEQWQELWLGRTAKQFSTMQGDFQ